MDKILHGLIEAQKRQHKRNKALKVKNKELKETQELAHARTFELNAEDLIIKGKRSEGSSLATNREHAHSRIEEKRSSASGKGLGYVYHVRIEGSNGSHRYYATPGSGATGGWVK